MTKYIFLLFALFGLGSVLTASAQDADRAAKPAEPKSVAGINDGLSAQPQHVKTATPTNDVANSNAGKAEKHTTLQMAGSPPDFKQLKQEKPDAKGKVNDVLPETPGQTAQPKGRKQAKDDAHSLTK